jgi:hypothetical protein
MAQRSGSGCTACAKTIDELATALGVSVRTLRRLQAAGTIEPTERAAGRRPAKYDPVAVACVLLGRPQDAQDARAARDKAQAEWLRLRVSRERGDVFPRAAVIRAGRAVIDVVRTRLQRIPAELVRAGAVLPDGELIAESLVRQSLEELAGLETVL